MPGPGDQPTKPADGRDRRDYVWWAAGLGLLALLGVFCLVAVVPVLQARRASRTLHASSTGPAAVGFEASQVLTERLISELGGRQRAAKSLTLYLRMPASWAPHRDSAVALLGSCGPHGVAEILRVLKTDDSLALRALGALGDAGRMPQPTPTQSPHSSPTCRQVILGSRPGPSAHCAASTAKSRGHHCLHKRWTASGCRSCGSTLPRLTGHYLC